MASFGDTINNPGDIKANGVAFQGITGQQSVQSNAGPTVTFDVFDNIIDGIRAVAKILATHLTKAGGSETVEQAAEQYLGTSTNNAENPNVQSYVQAVASGAGLTPQSNVTTANLSQLVTGIFKGEGTLSGVTSSQIASGISAAGFNGNDLLSDPAVSTSGFVNSDGTQAVNTIAANSNGQSLISTGAANNMGNPTSTANGQQPTPASSGPFSFLSDLVKQFDSTTFATRLVVVILGVILIAAAVFAFTKTNPVDIVARGAALAA